MAPLSRKEDPREDGGISCLIRCTSKPFCLLWEDLFTLLSPQGAANGRAPPKDTGLSSRPGIRLCTQELAGAPCPPALSSSTTPVSPSPTACKLSSGQTWLGGSRPRGVGRVLTGLQVAVGLGGRRARCGPCAGSMLRSLKAGDVGKAGACGPRRPLKRHPNAGTPATLTAEEQMTRRPRPQRPPRPRPGGAGIQAPPHEGRSPGARRAPWRRARGEQPWAPGFQDLPAAARECGAGGRGEASSRGGGCAFALRPSQTLPLLTFV